MRLLTTKQDQFSMQDEKTFCRNCRQSLETDFDKSNGYHASCYQDMLVLSPEFVIMEQLEPEYRLLVQRFIDMSAKFKITNSIINDKIEFRHDDYEILTIHLSSNVGLKQIISISYSYEDICDIKVEFDILTTRESITFYEFMKQVDYQTYLDFVKDKETPFDSYADSVDYTGLVLSLIFDYVLNSVVLNLFYNTILFFSITLINLKRCLVHRIQH